MDTPTHLAGLAARNNALWCDAVCRSHGRPGEFHDGLWLTRYGAPPLYPDAVTLSGPEAAPALTRAIAGLVGSSPRRAWAVKDSFRCLNLEPLGFEPLIEAEWLARRAPAGSAGHEHPQPRPMRVTSEAGLATWEKAWSEATGWAGPRLFTAGLLSAPDIGFVSVPGGGKARGGILNRGAGVVGLSNVFGCDADLVWRCLVAMAGEAFPGLPLVGYERDDELGPALRAGFEIVGPLRIWVRGGAEP